MMMTRRTRDRVRSLFAALLLFAAAGGECREPGDEVYVVVDAASVENPGRVQAYLGRDRVVVAVRTENEVPAGSRILKPEEKISALVRPGAPSLIYFYPDVSHLKATMILSNSGIGRYELVPFPLQPVFEVRFNDLKDVSILAEHTEVFQVWPAAMPRSICNLAAGDTINTDELQVEPYNLNGSGEILGIWDENGVRTTHQEFGGRVIQKDTPPYLSHHATHVTGTMAASGVDSNARGMATGVTVWAHNYYGDTWEWWQEKEDMLASNHSYTNYVGWQGISWWGPPDEEEDPIFGKYTPEAYDWDTMIHASNVLVVRAAGNERLHTGTTGAHTHAGAGTYYCYHRGDDWWSGGYDTMAWAPAAKNVLSVGAIDEITVDPYTDSDVIMTSFSSWGPTDDGRIKPDLMADGWVLYSASATSDSSYRQWSGTSMAAPGITGSSALLSQYYQTFYPGRPSALLLKTLLIHTVHDTDLQGPDYRYGWGIADIKAAADLIQTDGGSGDYLVEGSYDEGLTEYTFTLGSPEEIRITLSWFDPAGAPNTGGLNDPTPALVNDLDLCLVSPSEQVFYPWTLDRDNPWEAAVRSEANHVDNVEQVWVSQAESSAGLWKIQIRASSTILESQAWALVSSHPVSSCATAPEWSGWQAGYPAPASECGHISLVWEEALSGCGGTVVYDLYRSLTPGFTPAPSSLIAGSLDTPGYDDGPLDPGLTYYYRVIPREGDLEGSMSVEGYAQPGSGADPDPPDPVNDLVVSSGSGCGEILLSWSASEEFCSLPVIYRVYRDIAPVVALSPANLVGWTADIQFRDGAIPLDRYYYYAVTAEDQEGNVSVSSAVVGIDIPSGEILVFSEDCEGDLSGWTQGGDWDADTCDAHAGNYAFSLDLLPCLTYPGESSSDLTSPAIPIDTGNPPETLRFWHRFESEETYDSGEVLIDHNNDSVYTSLVGFTGDAAGDWREVKIDFVGLTGWVTPVTLRFSFSSDEMVQLGRGWGIDDVALYRAGTSCTGCTVPLEIENMKCTKSASDIDFTWDAETSSTTYRIYELTGEDFTDVVSLGVADPLSFTHTGALVLPGDFYYRVRGINACGEEGE